jgi:apolipoprotein D and lipocalin family protein
MNLNTTTVPNLDLNRYLGEWHQIATISTWFQPNLIEVKAKYSLLPNGLVQVENSGVGKIFRLPSKIKGTARIPEQNNPSKLKVRFPLFGEGDYNVLELDPNYQWALVGGSSPNNLWILSRSLSITMDLYNELKEKARLRGYNSSKLKITKTS